MGLSVRPEELIAFLKSKGFIFVRQNGTSHAIYTNGSKSVPIPIHAKDIKIGTLSSILRQCGLTKKEFEEWLGR